MNLSLLPAAWGKSLDMLSSLALVDLRERKLWIEISFTPLKIDLVLYAVPKYIQHKDDIKD